MQKTLFTDFKNFKPFLQYTQDGVRKKSKTTYNFINKMQAVYPEKQSFLCRKETIFQGMILIKMADHQLHLE